MRIYDAIITLCALRTRKGFGKKGLNFRVFMELENGSGPFGLFTTLKVYTTISRRVKTPFVVVTYQGLTVDSLLCNKDLLIKQGRFNLYLALRSIRGNTSSIHYTDPFNERSQFLPGLSAYSIHKFIYVQNHTSLPEALQVSALGF